MKAQNSLHFPPVSKTGIYKKLPLWLRLVGLIYTLLFAGMINRSLNAAEIPVFIFAGQSIAINTGTDFGRLSAEWKSPQTNVLFFNARVTSEEPTSDVHWVTYQPPTGPGFPSNCVYSNSDGSFGPEISAANILSKTYFGSGPVAVYKYAVGNTSLTLDYNPLTPGPLYVDMLTLLTNALLTLPLETGYQGKIAGVFWTQGESDAVNGEECAAEYGSNLLNFVTCLREVANEPRLPFVYGRITSAWPNADVVRLGQENLTHVLQDVFMVDADDLVTITLHYDNDGTIELGNRYAAGYEYIIKHRPLIEITSPEHNRLHIYSVPHAVYKLEYSEDLKEFNWNVLTTLQTDALGIYNFKIDFPQNNSSRFYRVTGP